MSDAMELPQSEKDRRKRKLLWQYAIVMFAAVLLAAIVGFGTGFLNGYLDHAENAPTWMILLRDVMFGPWLWAVIMIAGVVYATLWALAYWRQIDELARAAHEKAWFWGGSIAMGLGLGVLVIASVVPPFCNMTFDGLTQMQILAVGAGGITGMMIIGYVVAWAIIWWRAR